MQEFLQNRGAVRVFWLLQRESGHINNRWFGELYAFAPLCGCVMGTQEKIEILASRYECGIGLKPAYNQNSLLICVENLISCECCAKG